MKPVNKETIQIGPFPKGINNIEKETALPEGALREAVNVVIGDTGTVRRREGYTKVYSGANIHSVYKRYFMEGASLKYLRDDNSGVNVIASGLSGDTVSYCEAIDTIFLTDGITNSKISKGVYSLASVPTPTQAPSLVYTASGSLLPGKYQVTVAKQDIHSKELSGAPISSVIELTSVGGIVVTIPVGTGAYNNVVYMSRTSDSVLFMQYAINDLVPTYTLSMLRDDTDECSTQHLTALEPGHLIEQHSGKLYVASEGVLWYSEPHRYGLMRRSRNFFNFPSRITVCVAVESGIFVVADKTYFVSLTTDDKAQIKVVSDNTAVEGSSLRLVGTDVPAVSDMVSADEQIAYWFSDEGAMLGLPNGNVVPATRQSFVPPDNTEYTGASLFAQVNGVKQIVTSMHTGGGNSTLQANDTASLTIYRNGVIVP